MSEPFQLGAFSLLRPIGAGGQGTVWRAMHPPTGITLAIKVLGSLRAGDAAAQAAFRREVRAAAGLDHPNIIVVLDQGAVSREAAEASHGELTAGSPWLAMELARSSLADLPGARAWPQTRALLTALLEGLAHAHARGVVHRDLKPANVLFPSPPRTAAALSRARLADFGLAFGQGDLASSRRATGGTPLYMAPEQMRGDLVDQGPWTDLYALGWMAWELVTGAHPLVELEIQEIRALKTTGRLPPWPDDAAAPTGFDAWVHRLLHLDPRQRYLSAADALATLRTLPDDAPPTPERPLTQRVRPPSSVTMAFSGAGSVPSSERTWVEELPTAELMPVHVEGEYSSVEPAMRAAAPIPRRWSEARAERPPALQGAALGLFGLRTPPLVGREAECATVWAALTGTGEPGPPRVLLLRGGAGQGKTRLADWLLEQAHSQAGVVALRAAARASGPHGSLGAMLRRLFDTEALDDTHAAQRIMRALQAQGLFDPVDQAPLMQMAGLGVAGAPATQTERFAALNALLRAMSRERSVVVLVDDAPHSPEVLAWLKRLRAVQGLRVLVVLTARDEALAEDPIARAAIDALAPETLTVPPLAPDAQRDLVRSLLHLDDDLLATLVARTDGNPDFTLRLLGDWVSRGLLVVEPTGLRLRPGARPTLPDSLHAAWAAQVARVESSVGDRAGEMLELAAFLGMDVDLATWRGVCERSGLGDPGPLLEALLDAAFAHAAPGGRAWSFAHGMVRETVIRRARELGAERGHHAAIAAQLTATGASAGRIGRHRALAGDAAGGLPPLLQGIAEATERGELGWARRLVSLAQTATEWLGLPPEAPERLQLAVLTAHLHLQSGRFADVDQAVAGVADAAAAVSAGRLELRARLLLAQAALGRLDVGDARPRAAAHRARVDAIGDAHDQLQAELVQAQLEMYAGDVDAAEAHWAAARAHIDLATPDETALIRFGMAQIAQLRGDYARAARLAEASAAELESLGMRRRLAQALNTLGDALRKGGDPVGAVTAYRRAEHLLEASGAAHATVARLNIGITLLAAESFDEASATLRRTLGEVRAQGIAAYEYAVRHALLAVSAANRDAGSFDAHLAALEPIRDHGHFLDTDLATVAEQAGDLWHRAWDHDRARAAWRIAEAQWLGLHKDDDAARTRRKHARRPPP